MPSENNFTSFARLKHDKFGGRHEQQEAFIISLYNTYSSTLYSYILQIIPDKEKAAAVLYSAFVKAYEILKSEKDKDNLFIWLSNFCRNASIDILIEIRCTRETSVDPAALKAFLVRLPVMEKTILSLLWCRDYSVIKIANLLKLPLSLVECKLNLVKQKFENERLSTFPVTTDTFS